MCTVLLPPGVNPIAVKCISYQVDLQWETPVLVHTPNSHAQTQHFLGYVYTEHVVTKWVPIKTNVSDIYWKMSIIGVLRTNAHRCFKGLRELLEVRSMGTHNILWCSHQLKNKWRHQAFLYLDIHFSKTNLDHGHPASTSWHTTSNTVSTDNLKYFLRFFTLSFFMEREKWCIINLASPADLEIQILQIKACYLLS
jgi:hypothetical protein